MHRTTRPWGPRVKGLATLKGDDVSSGAIGLEGLKYADQLENLRGSSTLPWGRASEVRCAGVKMLTLAEGQPPTWNLLPWSPLNVMTTLRFGLLM